MLAGIFVIVCQLKINVTNAYAGSIAWSNFFSRLTHSHPGRVVWLVFNVLLALLLMEIGIFRAIESILVIYANFAAGWIGALTADLVINKPLGFSPRYIEFKRAHLYDINPVGVGALVALGDRCRASRSSGVFGTVAQILAPFIALFVGVRRRAADRLGHARAATTWRASQTGSPATAPRSAAASARTRSSATTSRCAPPIRARSARCAARWRRAAATYARRTAASRNSCSCSCAQCCRRVWRAAVNTRGGQFVGLMLLFNLAIGLLLAFIYHQYGDSRRRSARPSATRCGWCS